jgi:hypothetical protein
VDSVLFIGGLEIGAKCGGSLRYIALEVNRARHCRSALKSPRDTRQTAIGASAPKKVRNDSAPSVENQYRGGASTCRNFGREEATVKRDEPAKKTTVRRIVPTGPDCMSEEAFSRWQRRFDMLMKMLRESVFARVGRSTTEQLEAQRLERAAIALNGPAGRTLADCAAMNCAKLPAEIRAAARALPDSTLQLYDVVEPHGTGVVVRRIHDDANFVCHAIESDAGVITGEVYAIRLVDAGRFLAATLPTHVPAPKATHLAARLEQEFASRSNTWTWHEYLRSHGSPLILDVLDEAEQVPSSAADQAPDPLTSPSETSVGKQTWGRLARWYQRVAGLRGDDRLSRIELPTGCVADVYGSTEHTVFEVRNDDGGFLRVWSSGRDGAFRQDAEWSDANGRVVLAARQDGDHVWHDVTSADIEQLIAALRWVAVHSAIGDSRAA